jgi:hypothetical protein
MIEEENRADNSKNFNDSTISFGNSSGVNSGGISMKL